MKEQFERAEMDIIIFETEDVITASGAGGYTPIEDETPIIDPFNPGPGTP